MPKSAEKQWIKKQADPEKVESLKSALGCSLVLSQILVERGIETFDQAKVYFRPSTEYLLDPYTMLNMQSVIDTIQEAIMTEQKIMLYGDYDVDGTMSVSMFYNFFIQRYPAIIYYIPDRLTEGYGVSSRGIDFAIDEKVDLLITMDCGIRDFDSIAMAKKAGIQVIVIDHHTPTDRLPEADLILNPKQENDPYEYKELSAAGVVFKLLCAWSIMECGSIEHALPYIDLAALSTAADVVPLTGENRIILSVGLQEINKRINPVLTRMLELAGRGTSVIDEFDIGFVIGPRINAIGRLEKASEVVRIFTTQKSSEVDAYIDVFNTKNEERKKLDQRITEEALEQIESRPEWIDAKSTLVYDPSWHKGVVGIVASRLIPYYYRPTVVCTLDEGIVTCSARSIEGYNILAALDQCSDLFYKYGGHFYAAGISLAEENVDAFRERLEQVVSSTITEDILTPKIYIDATIDGQYISERFYNSVAQMAPFGEQNSQPNFRIREVSIIKDSLKLLKDQHPTFVVSLDGKMVKVIGFSMPEVYELMEANQDASFDMVVRLMRNEWRGNVNLEFQLQDLRLAE